MDEANVAVVIVTPATGELLDKCLASVARQTMKPKSVVVALNGCGGREELIAAWRDALPIEIISHDRNIGFAAAHDVGKLGTVSNLCFDKLVTVPNFTNFTGKMGTVTNFSKQKFEPVPNFPKWIALLNADAVAESDWLEEAVAAGEESSDIGAVASAVLMLNDGSRYESLGIEVGRSGAAYLKRYGERYREEGRQDVFGAAGAAALYRTEAVAQVGFFDADFFAYYEDVDLAWRIRMAGWRAVAAPRARVHHQGSAFASFSPRTFYTQRNRLAVIVMNWPLKSIARNLGRILLVDAASLILSAWREKSTAPLAARASFIISLPRLILKRLKRDRALSKETSRWLFDDWEKSLERLKWKIS